MTKVEKGGEIRHGEKRTRERRVREKEYVKETISPHHKLQGNSARATLSSVVLGKKADISV